LEWVSIPAGVPVAAIGNVADDVQVGEIYQPKLPKKEIS
jgi:hypothetical protein